METRLRALIVDDSDMSRRIAGRVVGKVFSYDEAENGSVAVRKYIEAIDSGTPYDIVFMDIIMPEMDGKEAVLRIREHEKSLEREKTPIIMISASETLEGIDGLVTGLLRKAISKPALDEILRKLFPANLLDV